MNASRLPAVGGAGRALATPWVGQLLQLLDERWSGTLLLQDDKGDSLAVLRLQAGLATAGIVDGSGTLLEQLTPLCDRADARIVRVDGVDLLDSAPEVTLGAIDPLRLMMIALRGRVREDVIDGAIALLGQDLLKLNPRTDLDRYGFEPNERRAVADLAHAPASLEQLRRQAALSQRDLYRVLYALIVTRGVTVVPSWRRIVSGAVLHAEPPAAPPEPYRNDEPTRVMRTMPTDESSVQPRVIASPPPPRRSVPYSLRAPANGSESVQPPSDGGAPAALYSSPELDPDGYFRLAQMLLERDHCSEAVLEAQKAMRISPPRPEQRALYAWLLYRRGGGESVQDCVWDHLEQALQEDPTCAIAHYFMGVLLKRVGQLEQGRFHLEQALELESED
jgi:tetratricopeptide (TPR) repeat protein